MRTRPFAILDLIRELDREVLMNLREPKPGPAPLRLSLDSGKVRGAGQPDLPREEAVVYDLIEYKVKRYCKACDTASGTEYDPDKLKWVCSRCKRPRGVDHEDTK